MHFPDDVDTNQLTIEANDPKSGTAEFKASAIRECEVACWTSASWPTAHRPSASVEAVRGPWPRAWPARPDRRRTPPPHAPPRAPGPAAARAPRRQRPRRLDQPGRLNEVCRRLSVRAGRGLRRRHASTTCSRSSPVPARVVHVCVDLACAVAGSHRRRGEHPSPCLGLCERAPAALLLEAGERRHREARRSWRRRVVRCRSAGDPSLVLLRRVGVVDPAASPPTAPHGGYAALRTAFELGPAGVLARARTERARRPGRCGVPRRAQVGRRRRAAHRPQVRGRQRRRVRARHVQGPRAAGARPLRRDRGDDRSRAGPSAPSRVRLPARRVPDAPGGGSPHAIDAAARRLARRRRARTPASRFDVEIRRARAPTSAARRPRCSTRSRATAASRAPSRRSPSTVGLFGRPTLVHNVETLANVLPILRGRRRVRRDRHRGVDRHEAVLRRRARSPGPASTRCRSGPRWASCSTSRAASAGGRPLQAVLLGGAAGAFVGPDAARHAAHLEGTRAVGATLGSGAVIVLDDTVDLVAVVLRIAAFFRDESCGQCVPCRVGTVRQEEALAPPRRAGRRPVAQPTSSLLLDDVGNAMRDASICGLGQTAWNAVRRRWPSCGPSERRVRRAGRRVDGRAAAPDRRRDRRRQPVEVAAGATILDACRPAASTHRRSASATRSRRQRLPGVRRRGAGNRALVPACSRQAVDGHGGPHRHRRVRHARRLVLELLAASVDLVDGARVDEWNAEYGAEPDALRRRGRHRRAAGEGRQRPLRARLLQVHPLLPVRRRVRRAVAEHVRHRGRRARASTPASPPSTTSPLPESACVYCGNCIEVCPTDALMFRSERDDARRRARGTRPARRRPTRSAPTAASAAPSRCTCRTTAS